METGITPVRFNKGHSEFYNYIESFPDQKKILEGPGHLPQKQVMLDHLRKELLEMTLNPQKIQNRLCYRNCFKWTDREYVEFCLNKKCNQNNFEEAARTLNYLK